MAMNDDFLIDTCAQEPIHLSGAIQPHGFLVACRREDWAVAYASDNVDALLNRTARSLLGEDLRAELSADVVQAITDALARLDPGRPAQRCCRNNVGAFGQLCDVSVHMDLRHVILEFEPVRRHWLDASASVLAEGLIGRTLGHDAGDGFFDACARNVRQMTGFDRVMVYRFLHDGAGEVVAEACGDGVATYLGLRFPAFDIPVQARALYVRNRIRAIPDAAYAPVPLVSAESAPLDLGHALLRSVSPVHVQYLANMDVASSLSVSIVSGGQLWGLVVCHHGRPHHLDPPMRTALELFGRFVSLRVTGQQQEELLEEANAVDYLADAVGGSVLRTGNLAATLLQWMAPMRVLLGADAAAVHASGCWIGTSTAIDAGELACAERWLLDARFTEIVHTERAADWSDRPGGEYAGMLGLQLVPGVWLVLLRRELVRTVRWAGEPHKVTDGDDDGVRIGPRRSFREWQETVRGRSAPWAHAELRKIRRFCRGLGELRRRAGASTAAAEAALLSSRQGVLDERRARLLEITHMLEALPPLDDALSRAVVEKIRTFDRQLRDLILRPDVPRVPVVDRADATTPG